MTTYDANCQIVDRFDRVIFELIILGIILLYFVLKGLAYLFMPQMSGI